MTHARSAISRMTARLSARSIATVIVAALALCVWGVEPALAYTFEWHNSESEVWANGTNFCAYQTQIRAAVGCFQPPGDVIGAGDLKADGHRVGVHWKTGYGRSGICVNTRGEDAVIVQGLVRGEHLCRINVKENAKIKIRSGRCDGSKVNCNKLKNWKNWSGWSRWIGTSEDWG